MKSLRSRLLLFATFLLVCPFFLRRRPRVERRITILAPPSAIYPFLHDLQNWPKWTAWSGQDALEYTYSANSTGSGAEQRWQGRQLSGVLRLLKCETDERLDYELLLDGDFAPIVGRIELHPDGACTRVIWKCAWDRAKNPYRRYLDQFMRWMIGREFIASLGKLKSVVESASPQSITA